MNGDAPGVRLRPKKRRKQPCVSSGSVKRSKAIQWWDQSRVRSSSRLRAEKATRASRGIDSPSLGIKAPAPRACGAAGRDDRCRCPLEAVFGDDCDGDNERGCDCELGRDEPKTP